MPTVKSCKAHAPNWSIPDSVSICFMNDSERHPTWVSPTPLQLITILGDCLSSPVSNVIVTASPESLSNPTLEFDVNCWKFPEGHEVKVPFLLMDTADTIKEQIQLGVDSAQLALDALCATCPFRSSVG